MVNVKLGQAVLAAAVWLQLSNADAVEQADLWVGIAETDHGFLIDTSSGEMWMTGACLKPLAPATLEGSVWSSTTTELVSVGRVSALLSQTFVIDTNAAAPAITVENPYRGGVQVFSGVARYSCDVLDCGSLTSAPRC